MGTIFTEIEVDIEKILDNSDYYDIRQVRELYLKQSIKDYYHDQTNVDPIIAIKHLKEAGVDLKKVSDELLKWYPLKVNRWKKFTDEQPVKHLECLILKDGHVYIAEFDGKAFYNWHMGTKWMYQVSPSLMWCEIPKEGM